MAKRNPTRSHRIGAPHAAEVARSAGEPVAWMPAIPKQSRWPKVILMCIAGVMVGACAGGNADSPETDARGPIVPLSAAESTDEAAAPGDSLAGIAPQIEEPVGTRDADEAPALQPASAPTGADWPQWRGPSRSGLSIETGLLREWPASGPAQVWSVSGLGAGYGSVAVSGDRIFVQGMRGRESVVSSLNRVDGRTVWTRPLGPAAGNDRGSGPRGTPTVDGDRVYVLTEVGDLACLRFEDGIILWQRNILDDFRGQNPQWRISESPLVDGELVIVTPGGRDAGMVALDKRSGETIWTSAGLSDEAAYSSPIVAAVQGVRTVMTLTSRGGVGVRVSDGRLMWRYDRVANRTANVATPVFHDNKVFFTSNYGVGGALLDLTAEAGEVQAREIYFTRDMQNHHGGVVLVDGVLYGFHNAILTAMDFATGRVIWRDRSVGKGAVTYADGHLYLVSEHNVVGLAEATPTGYHEKGRFTIADQGWPSWAHPVVSGGRLYVRNQETLSSYDVRRPSPMEP